jgi:hypothetical protein
MFPYEQEKQGFREGVEHAKARSKRPLFCHSVFGINMGTVQILPLEAVVDILENS